MVLALPAPVAGTVPPWPWLRPVGGIVLSLRVIRALLGRQQDERVEHEFLGLLADHVQPADPVQVSLPWRVALGGAHLRPRVRDVAGGTLAKPGEVSARIVDRGVPP